MCVWVWAASRHLAPCFSCANLLNELLLSKGMITHYDWSVGNVMTLNKNLSFAEISASSGASQVGAVEQNFLCLIRPAHLGTNCGCEWSWRGTQSHTSLLRFHLCCLHISQSQSAQGRPGAIWNEKVHNFCLRYIVLSRPANRSPLLIISVTSTRRRTDFLPLSAGVLIVTLHGHASAHARMHTHTVAAQRKRSTDVTPDAEGAPSCRETGISACCALTNEDIQSVFVFFSPIIVIIL